MPLMRQGLPLPSALPSLFAMPHLIGMRLRPPSRFSPICAVTLCLFAAGSANAAARLTAAPAPGTHVEFNDQFVRSQTGTAIDVARFNEGTPVLPGDYRVDVYLNDTWIGRLNLVFRDVDLAQPGHAQPFFTQALLERIGVDLHQLPQRATQLLQAAGNSGVLLPALLKDASANFDQGTLRLDVSIPQAMLARHHRDYVDPKDWDDGVPAALLRYDANTYRFSTDGRVTTQSYLGLRGGLNLGPWRLRYNGNLSSGDSGTRYQGVSAYLQRGIAAWKSQLTIGDAFTDGQMFDSAGLRGVTLASDPRMYPQSERGFAPTIRGVARSNAKVRVSQNGNIIYETTVAPGPFVIDDLYPTGYGGDLNVTVTEADGSVRAFSVPYTAAPNMLRPGITQYTAAFGQYRNPGLHGTPLLAQATVQHGINNWLTGYGGVTLTEGYWSAVLGAGVNTPLGAVALDVTHAVTTLPGQHDRVQGQSVRLSYAKSLPQTGTDFALAAYRYSTRGYLNLSDAMWLREALSGHGGLYVPSRQRNRLELTVNQSLGNRYGSFYLSGSTQSYWDRPGTDMQYQVGYSNSFKRLNYTVSAARQRNIASGDWENSFFVTLMMPLGRAGAPTLSASLHEGSHQGQSWMTSLSGTAGRGDEFTYNVNAARSSGGGAGATTNGGVNVNYTSPYATLSGSATADSLHATQTSVSASGSVVAYPGGVALSPETGDTVAIVEANDAGGARVTNALGARVAPWGREAITDLAPYQRNDIELDPTGLPVNIELRSTRQTVTPTAGAVVKAHFDTLNTGRAAIINARLPDGKPLPFGADVTDASDKRVGVVTQGSRLLVHGLGERGTLTVRWAQPMQQCQVHYALPASKGSERGYVPLTATCNPERQIASSRAITSEKTLAKNPGDANVQTLNN
ncbi:fimbria/pilus outer membrane usher protein [Burkholderia pyrrocinia]